MNYWLDILNNYTNYNTIPYNINVNKNISTIINIFYEKNYFLDFETEYIKKNFSNLVDAIHNITDISYNKDIRFNFYNNIFDNLNTIYNNNIQYKKNITFCFYKLFIKLLHTKKCYIIFNNSKYENSINLIKKYNYNFLDVFNINEIVIKYGSFGTLKLLQKNFIFF